MYTERYTIEDNDNEVLSKNGINREEENTMDRV